MRKYIYLFEELNQAYIKDSMSDVKGSWMDIRNTIQKGDDFCILCFKTPEDYSAFVEAYDGDYIKQEFYYNEYGDGQMHKSCPSVFVPTTKLKIFGGKDPFKEADLICMIYPNGDSIDVNFNGTINSIGNELISSASPDELNSEDYFKIDSTFYRFLDVM